MYTFFTLIRPFNDELAKEKTRLEYSKCFVLLHIVINTVSQLKLTFLHALNDYVNVLYSYTGLK